MVEELRANLAPKHLGQQARHSIANLALHVQATAQNLDS
jgi:hypothetical protein